MLLSSTNKAITAHFSIHLLISFLPENRNLTVDGRAERMEEVTKRNARKRSNFYSAQSRERWKEIIKTKQVAHFDVGMIDDKIRNSMPS